MSAHAAAGSNNGSRRGSQLPGLEEEAFAQLEQEMLQLVDSRL
jgi:hypothetical protein